MQLSTLFTLLASLSAYAVAQQTGNDGSNTQSCDGSGTCTSSVSTGLATRLSYVTYTTTNVGTVITTDVGTSRFITSLPASLSTYTTQIPLDTTLVPLYTESVISGQTVVTTNTANGQVETTITGGTTVSVTPTTSVALVSSGASVASTSTAGAPAVTFAPALVGAAALGFAALL